MGSTFLFCQKPIMRVYMKICENPNCWEVMWAFPKTKCQFCGSKEFSTHVTNIRAVLWGSTEYASEDKHMCVIKNYKWCDHVLVRQPKWNPESNECDNNGGYTHFPMVDNVDEVEILINSKITKYWEYIPTEENIEILSKFEVEHFPD